MPRRRKDLGWLVWLGLWLVVPLVCAVEPFAVFAEEVASWMVSRIEAATEDWL